MFRGTRLITLIVPISVFLDCEPKLLSHKKKVSWCERRYSGRVVLGGA